MFSSSDTEVHQELSTAKFMMTSNFISRGFEDASYSIMNQSGKNAQKRFNTLIN